MSPVQQIDLSEMRQRLLEFYAQDPESDWVAKVKQRLADSVRPQNEKGRFRPHSLLVLLGTIALIATGAFLYFSYFQP